MAGIPTMACKRCDGTGIATRVEEGWGVVRERCWGGCSGTGRISRPPLTAEEIAALPDGARVVVDYDDVAPGCLRGGVITGHSDREATRRLVLDGVRVWLADGGEE